MTKELKKVELVYAGRVAGQGRKLQAYYNTSDEKMFYFGSKLKGWENVGSVLTAETYDNKKGTTGFKNVVTKRTTEPEDKWFDKINEWTVENRIAIEEDKLKSEASKEHQESFEGVLDLLVKSMWKFTPRQKYQFGLYVFHKIINS